MSKPYKTTKSFYPGAGFDGSVGKERNATVGYTAPADQEKPQDPVDQRDRSYDTTVRMDWRRGGGKGQAEGMPHFDHYRDRKK